MFLEESDGACAIPSDESYETMIQRKDYVPIFPKKMYIDTTKATLASISFHICGIKRCIESCSVRSSENRASLKSSITGNLDGIRESLEWHYKNNDEVAKKYGIYWKVFRGFWECGPNELGTYLGLCNNFEKWIKYELESRDGLPDSEIANAAQVAETEPIWSMDSGSIMARIHEGRNRPELARLSTEVTAKTHRCMKILNASPDAQVFINTQRRIHREMLFLLQLAEFYEKRNKEFWQCLKDRFEERSDDIRDLSMCTEYLNRIQNCLTQLTIAQEQIDIILREVFPEEMPTLGLSREELAESQKQQQDLINEANSIKNALSKFHDDYAPLFPGVPDENKIPPAPGTECQHEKIMNTYTAVLRNVVDELNYNTSITPERVSEMYQTATEKLEEIQGACSYVIRLCRDHVELKRKLGSGDDELMRGLLSLLKGVHNELGQIHVECELWRLKREVESLTQSLQKEDSLKIQEIFSFLAGNKKCITATKTALARDLPLIETQTLSFLDSLEKKKESDVDFSQLRFNSNALETFNNLFRANIRQLLQYKANLEVLVSKYTASPHEKLLNNYKDYIMEVLERFDKAKTKLQELIEMNEQLFQLLQWPGIGCFSFSIQNPCEVTTRLGLSASQKEQLDIEEAIRRSMQEM